jgi:hypothetical protein
VTLLLPYDLARGLIGNELRSDLEATELIASLKLRLEKRPIHLQQDLTLMGKPSPERILKHLIAQPAH